MLRPTHLGLLFILSVFGSGLAAQSIVVPNANANSRGVGGFNTLVRDTGQPRTHMLGIPASELAGIPIGSVINGVSLRASVGAPNPPTWPPVDTTWSNYEVTIGYAAPLATWTGTFMSHFVNTPIPPVLVRTGPMVMEPNAFPNNGNLPTPTPNAFADFFWDFQKPFLYIGGDLGILFTHAGSDQPGSFVYIDYVQLTPPAGVAYSASTFQAPSGTVSPCFAISRIHYVY
jgi:hypothetical protein